MTCVMLLKCGNIVGFAIVKPLEFCYNKGNKYTRTDMPKANLKAGYL